MIFRVFVSILNPVFKIIPFVNDNFRFELYRNNMRLFNLTIILFLLPFLLCCTNEEVVPAVEGLFINEIYAAGDDWIELYNSLDEVKDISGYAIYDDATRKYKLPSGTTIPARGFLILNCNDLGVGLDTNFKLSSTGETVYLDNVTALLIDKVEFPPLDNGQVYARFPDGAAKIVISGNATKGVTNGDSQAPDVNKVNQIPIVPSLDQTVDIEVILVSNNDIASVKLYHRFNGESFSSLSMVLSGTAYIATIPAKSTTGLMEYYIEVKGTNDKTSYSPANAPSKAHQYLLNNDILPSLVINEFMAFNTSCCPDKSSGATEYDDWVEIYNAGSVDVNIGGMYLSDDKTNPFKHKIITDNAALTTIAPGGYLIIWADNTQSQGPLHVEFALANTGEDIGLFYKDGRTIDSYTFGLQNENTSTAEQQMALPPGRHSIHQRRDLLINRRFLLLKRIVTGSFL